MPSKCSIPCSWNDQIWDHRCYRIWSTWICRTPITIIFVIVLTNIWAALCFCQLGDFGRILLRSAAPRLTLFLLRPTPRPLGLTLLLLPYFRDLTSYKFKVLISKVLLPWSFLSCHSPVAFHDPVAHLSPHPGTLGQVGP